MFQSTRPCGARRQLDRSRPSLPSGFNPRARAGRDRYSMQADIEYIEVSIHAPVRGATLAAAAAGVVQAGRFNPRARAGRDSDHNNGGKQ